MRTPSRTPTVEPEPVSALVQWPAQAVAQATSKAPITAARMDFSSMRRVYHSFRPPPLSCFLARADYCIRHEPPKPSRVTEPRTPRCFICATRLGRNEDGRELHSAELCQHCLTPIGQKGTMEVRAKRPEAE